MSDIEQLEQAHTAMRNAKIGEDEWFDVVKFCVELLLRREIEKAAKAEGERESK